VTALSHDILRKDRELVVACGPMGATMVPWSLTRCCAVEPVSFCFTLAAVARRIGIGRQAIVNWIELQ
jgi:hypothetical protein